MRKIKYNIFNIWYQYVPTNETFTFFFNNLSNSIKDLMIENENEKKFLNEILVQEIICSNFSDLPNITFLIKEKYIDEFQNYNARISKYPNYLLKNNSYISKYDIKKIIIDNIVWVEADIPYYSITDNYGNNFIIYCERLYKKIN